MLLGIGVVGVMAALVGLAAQKEKKNLLVLDWANKATADTPPVAVLVEFGLKDKDPTDWNSKAAVAGAKVVHREGYRFRASDRLVEPDAWEVKSHRPIRVPQGQPAVARLEGIVTVGVVLHLAELKPDATLTLEPTEKGDEKAVVELKGVVQGKAQEVWGGKAVVRRVTTATALTSGKTEDDFPAAAYGPDGTLWVAYISYTVRDEKRRMEQNNLREQPKDFKEFYTPEFADQLFVKYYKDGKWSEPLAVTGATEDLVRCAVAVEGNGDAWVFYSAHRKGGHDIYARPISPKFNPAGVAKPEPKLGPEQKVTVAGGCLTPVACTDQKGQVWLACQCWDEGGDARIVTMTFRQNKWEQTKGVNPVGQGPFHFWYPALAASPQGNVTAGYDIYFAGDYDVHCYNCEGEKIGLVDVATSARLEARPSLAYDNKGRLWIAYEEGPEKWGKDYGAVDPGDGNPLYNERSVRVVCLEGGKLMEPVAKLPHVENPPPRIPYEAQTGPKYERTTRYSSPQLGLDGKGRLWLTYREKFGTRTSSIAGSYWLTFARRLDGDHWTEPIEVHHSDGLLDSRPVMLPYKSGGLLIIHNTDGRYTTPEKVQNQIYSSVIDLPGDLIEPKLVQRDAGKKDTKKAKGEEALVKRMKDYRMEVGGSKYQLLRGEYHRHTEISWDGGPDGTLEDMFRYAIDSAGMDWIGNGDHDNGAGREYSWWLVQKLTDAYHVKNHFTPMFTYERSVNYPHGHRNVMFAKRGMRTLPRLAQPDMEKRVGGVHADDTKMLYRYLHELDGICAVHTSATSMGTDWRDNDPEVEPIVEIYQGDRMSYEQEEAPRAGYDPKTDKLPANIAGWFPDGFVDHALRDKGYKLAFQASSDHWSTHISFFIVLAEKHDRDGMLAAIKKRHCYGATDFIIVDVRSGKHVMGDSFSQSEPVKLDMNIAGTGPLERIDIIKDSRVVKTIEPKGPEYKGEWTDDKADGKHYYYVRVMQKDRAMAWGSPMWVEYGK
jgi:hypothetical protein